MISIFIADDHELICKAISAQLSKTPDLECTGQASNGTELLLMIKAAPKAPDICLLDLRMPFPTSLEEFILKLKRLQPKLKIVAYSSHFSRPLLYTLIAKTEISGYILKEGSNSELITGLRKIAQGEKYYSPRIYPTVISILKKRDAINMLNEREKDILELILDDESEMAEKLNLSPFTVRKYISRIKMKLNLNNRFEILKFAIEYNYITPTL